MRQPAKQRLLSSCLAALIALSPTLTPIAVNAAPANAPKAYTRIGGVDQYATAALMAQKGWPGTADNVVLSAGMNYTLVDALAAGPLAAKLNAPILLTDGEYQLNPAAKAELQRLKPKKVYITSGTAVIKPEVIRELESMGMTPVQLGGYDQYETSVNIAKELARQGALISRVVLAAGWLSPADALSVAPIAAAQEMPILTTTQGQLPASVKVYLDSIKAQVKESYVVGGSAVVSTNVQGDLPGRVSRYAGKTKYDTNLQILENWAEDYKNDQVYVANGETLVDALAGVPLAALNQAPLLLVNQELETTTKQYVKLNLSTANMIALGGEAVVPSTAMNTMTSTILYSIDSAVVGSTDAAKPVRLTDNVKITGDNVTLENADMDYSLYVTGDNVTLSNLKVLGTVFLDPGDNGSATLNDVRAGKIVILSGAKDRIHINNTTTIPPSGSAGTPPVNPPTNPTVPTSVNLSDLRVITDPANNLGTFDNGDEIDLSDLDDDVKVIGFAVTADQDCTLQFKVLSEVQNIALRAGRERIVTVGDLLLGTSLPGGVALKDFRILYEKTKTKTLQGKLLIDDNSVGTLSVKLRFLD